MSQPPIPPPLPGQPPFHSPYPRATVVQYGSATKLRLLQRAYYQSYFLIAWAVIIILPLQYLLLPKISDTFASAMTILLAVNFPLAFILARKVAMATGKSTGYAVILALVGAVFSGCCLGLVSCMIIQQAVTNEVKNYGMKGGFLGLKKQDFEDRIRALEAMGRP